MLKIEIEIVREFAIKIRANKYFINNNLNVSKFNFKFHFDDFVNKILLIYFVINFGEIFIENKKIDNKKIVNVDKIIHEMKIYFS